jgi:hypothetical protein
MDDGPGVTTSRRSTGAGAGGVGGIAAPNPPPSIGIRLPHDPSIDPAQFINTLWKILEDQSNSNALGWERDGMSFTINDEDTFATRLLPIHFKHSSVSNFLRQIQAFGFRKNVKSQRELSFMHESFVRGRPDLLAHITRKNMDAKTQYIRAKSDMEGVQDDLDQVRRYHGKLLDDVNQLSLMIKTLAEVMGTHILRHDQGKLKDKLKKIEINAVTAPAPAQGSKGALPLASLQKIRSERGKRKASAILEEPPTPRRRSSRRDSKSDQEFTPEVNFFNDSPATNTRSAKSKPDAATPSTPKNDWTNIIQPVAFPAGMTNPPPFLVPKRDSAFTDVTSPSSLPPFPVIKPESISIPKVKVEELPPFRKPPKETEKLKKDWNDFPSTFWSDFELMKKRI